MPDQDLDYAQVPDNERRLAMTKLAKRRQTLSSVNRFQPAKGDGFLTTNTLADSEAEGS